MNKQYDIGDVAVLRAAFSDDDGEPVDPTTVKLAIREPDGTETVYTHPTDIAVIKDSVGVYHFDLPLTGKGNWFYRWIGSGTAAAAGEAKLLVKASAFTTPLPE
jgi:hypothetical protein